MIDEVFEAQQKWQHQLSHKQFPEIMSTNPLDGRIAGQWSRVEMAIDFLNHMVTEISELRQVLPARVWKPETYDPEYRGQIAELSGKPGDAAQEELAVVFIHFCNVCYYLGVDSDILYSYVSLKQIKNRQRQDHTHNRES